MLYSNWVILAVASGAVAAYALLRFLIGWKKADGIDIILLFLGGFFCFIVALTAGDLDFVCTSGTYCINGVQSYHGDYYFFYIYLAPASIDFIMTIVAAIVTLGNVFRRRRQGY